MFKQNEKHARPPHTAVKTSFCLNLSCGKPRKSEAGRNVFMGPGRETDENGTEPVCTPIKKKKKKRRRKCEKVTRRGVIDALGFSER